MRRDPEGQAEVKQRFFGHVDESECFVPDSSPRWWISRSSCLSSLLPWKSKYVTHFTLEVPLTSDMNGVEVELVWSWFDTSLKLDSVPPETTGPIGKVLSRGLNLSRATGTFVAVGQSPSLYGKGADGWRPAVKVQQNPERDRTLIIKLLMSDLLFSTLNPQIVSRMSQPNSATFVSIGWQVFIYFYYVWSLGNYLKVCSTLC